MNKEKEIDKAKQEKQNLIDEIKESEDQLTKMKGKQMTINKQKEELERELFEMKEEFKRLEAN